MRDTGDSLGDVEGVVTNSEECIVASRYKLCTKVYPGNRSWGIAIELQSGRKTSYRQLSGDDYRMVLDVYARLGMTVDGRDDEDAAMYNKITSQVNLVQHNRVWYYFASPNYGSLHQYVSDHDGLTEETAQRLCKQIVEIVLYCHRRDICLCDLKLRKFVFVDAQHSTISLSDIDGFRVEDGVGQISTGRCGSLAYVSPELLNPRCTSYFAKHCDIWSCGVIFYLVMFKKYPFFDVTPLGLVRKIRVAQVTFPRTDRISLAAQRLLLSMLCKCPVERPSAADLLDNPYFSCRFVKRPIFDVWLLSSKKLKSFRAMLPYLAAAAAAIGTALEDEQASGSVG